MDATQRETNRIEWENPDNWGGPDWMAFYFSKRDTRVWVPKRRPWMGWTFNLGQNGGVYWLVAFMIGIPMVILVAALGVVAGAAQANSISPAAFPPVVVETVPAAGDLAVDPSLSEIRVTFSKDLTTN